MDKMDKKDVVRDILRDRPLSPGQAASAAYAPANIALVKYWGKRNITLNLPVTDSLSVSLGELGTQTRLQAASGGNDEIFLNGNPVEPSQAFAARLTAFLDLVRPSGHGFRIETTNTIATAAGLASSASGFAALVQALDAYFGWELTLEARSILARLGSGSACRSVYDGFVHWHRGQRDDGMDSFAKPLPTVWPEFRVAIVTVCDTAKPHSSRDAMARTVDTSPFYSAWPRQVAADIDAAQDALVTKQFTALGALAERNALCMHATMMAAKPPVIYWLPETMAICHQVWRCREQGHEVYFTIDAGPNVKLLFLERESDVVRQHFPEAVTVSPFADSSDNGVP